MMDKVTAGLVFDTDNMSLFIKELLNLKMENNSGKWVHSTPKQEVIILFTGDKKEVIQKTLIECEKLLGLTKS